MKLDKLEKLLKEQSEKMNLFSAADRLKIKEKHFADSEAVLKFWDVKDGMEVLDIGTGGGLPGLVLACENPNVNFTMLDSTKKKIDAINEVIEKMELENASTLCGRIEELAHLYHEKFDIVTARALAPLSVLLEYAVGFLKPGGILYSWKANYEEEFKLSQNAQKILKMEKIAVYDYELPGGEQRTILAFKKNGKTDKKYPRRVGIPSKSPL